jgi:hypothetical protein
MAYPERARDICPTGCGKLSQPRLRTVAGDASEAGEIAHWLYRATLDLLRDSTSPCAERHALLEPLSRAVACQKTREGQAACARIEASLAANDYEAALDACLGLIAIAERV